ncbi:hypothetical protein NC652_039167 [Populus alba x Populus x berolinensis]|uniref:Uncharacterized protein n=1 Tax=Populus alba x Populus x berolinensis TaxID=444605 RepID=A0AAD6LAI6_9ROSI|nr:hypothetical protein NC651_038116 [Populus alba x Populus x berolinensis]KAJ6862247.1 hypothetical protein NC652_039167 [Populus alba x Populus x berolinensis]KAJ6957150.1 hypothetical protein NC653_039160 [Populus alba x Populus x berolinensis]
MAADTSRPDTKKERKNHEDIVNPGDVRGPSSMSAPPRVHGLLF